MKNPTGLPTGNKPVVTQQNSAAISTGYKTASPQKNPTLKKRKSDQVCEEYANEIEEDLNFNIINGEEAVEKEFPHMVALGYNSDTIGLTKWDCGGSLISKRFVLTAAHCIINPDQNPPVKIKMGMIELNDTSASNKNIQEFDIVNITIHPEYKRWDKFNDLALLKINKDVTYTFYAHPACLYTKDQEPSEMTITGWGSTETSDESSNILLKAKLSAVSLQSCNETYSEKAFKTILRTQICAVDNRSDTCQGDSGGPLQVQNIPHSKLYSIVGITSYGIGCGTQDPGVYTRVSSYLDWIENLVWGKS